MHKQELNKTGQLQKYVLVDDETMKIADRFNQRKKWDIRTGALKLNSAIMNLSRIAFKILEECRFSIMVTT
jgi:hypothetical protein